MRILLQSTVVLLVLASGWQNGLGEQSGPRTDEAGSASTQPGTAGRQDCERSLSRALVNSKVSAQRLIGMPVVNPLNQDIGQVVDLVLDRCGSITHVIVHVGGFMGIGGRKVAVPVDKVRIMPGGPSSSWVVLVRETRQHMLQGYDEYSRQGLVK